MAVYKPTYCQPYLSSVDPRCAVSSADVVFNETYNKYEFQFKPKFECLSCRVDTSNINVTGYSIKLLDENNEVVFPVSGATISPITELQRINELGEENSGVNGTVLKIPFFQNCNIYRYSVYDDYVYFSTTDAYVGYYVVKIIDNKRDYELVTSDNKNELEITPGTTVAYNNRTIGDEETLLKSHNAIYYKPKYLANHIIMSSDVAATLGYALSMFENSANWSVFSNKLVYDGITPDPDTYVYLDSEPVFDGDVIFVADTDTNKFGLYRAVVENTEYNHTSIILKPIVTFTGINNDDIITVTNGSALHNCSFSITKSGSAVIAIDNFNYDSCWVDIFGENTLLPVNSSSIKWVLTLYQGNSTTVSQPAPMSIDYSEIEEKYFDIKLSTGTILGSTPERVQIASSDPIDFWGDLYNPETKYTEGDVVKYFDGNGELGCSYYTHKRGSTTGTPPSDDNHWYKDGDIGSPPLLRLPEERSGPIVLQEKFMALSSVCTDLTIQNGSQEIFNSPRVAIKSYDNTYGHVYPETKKLQSETLSAATHCQFFKSSNNLDEILESDIITWSVGPDWGVSIDPNESYLPLFVYPSENDSESILSKRIVIDDSPGQTLPSAIFVNDGAEWHCLMADGDLILLTGQGNSPGVSSFPWQNGIYKYEISSIDYGGHTYKHTLRRVNPYNTWAKYIGKVFFCKKGTYAGRNVECLASAGGELWNPNGTQSGYSSLLFSYEQPILLFPQLLPNNRVFDLYYDGVYDSEIQNQLIDEYTVSVGMVVFFKNNRSAKVTSIDAEKIYFGASSTEDIIRDGEYAYILNGENYGKCVLKILSDDTIGITWDLHTARVLKNMPVLTYVSPYSGTRPGMALKLLSGNKITYVSGQNNIIIPQTYERVGSSGTTSPWVLINFIDDSLNYIVHSVISEDSAGIDAGIYSAQRGDFSYGLSSYSDDADIPWKYSLFSYFNESNENQFSLLESPYLILNKNGNPYIELTPGSISELSDDGFVLDILSSVIEDNVYDSSLELSYYKYKDSDWYETKRFVNIFTDYVNFNSGSWESYRWLLFGSNGDILQDTGYKYDNRVDVSFYGLNIPYRTYVEHIPYYAVLLLTDNINKNYCVVIKICTKYANPEPINNSAGDAAGTPATFSAILDSCSTAVVLNLSQSISSPETGSYLYSFYKREYNVYKKPGARIQGYFDKDNNTFYHQIIYHDGQLTYKDKISPHRGYIYVDIGDESFEYEYVDGEFVKTPVYGQYQGEWEPVLLGITLDDFDKDENNVYNLTFRDYHISADRSYQYIAYCTHESTSNNVSTTEDSQLFANWDGVIFEPTDAGQGVVYPGDETTAAINGAPVHVNWDYWNIVELIPEEIDINAPIVKKAYRVDMSQVWKFKFSLETGAQTQNISRSEFQTLGEFPKVGFGRFNYVSGDVSALLGSEVVPYRGGYVERLSKSPLNPASTNERAALLNQWRKFVSSRNPKLLRDIKGQQWIVQIMSSSNTPKNFYKNQPDTISFQWKQVGDTENTIIYTKGDDVV